MSEGGAFAEVDELGYPLSSSTERDIAEQLLIAAAKWIRENAPEPLDPATAKIVSIEVVATAMTTRAYAGHISYTRTTGPRTKAGTLVNPGGALVFSDWHKELLGIAVHAQPSWNFGDCPP
ncbi:hypothetical protein C5E45_32980 [Nocardia nova]|uniref:Head-to-tail adaptor n=1 Tax=Nocardia nova TaxID=37330 RepID=A0A2S6AD07_9NOCA|nr:hypothetical protein [Nocardia nova]PPJ31907.1 hypothetical protein C5E45_32980 [Nocardia nova]